LEDKSETGLLIEEQFQSLQAKLERRTLCAEIRRELSSAVPR
jgi:hypothetical protein